MNAQQAYDMTQQGLQQRSANRNVVSANNVLKLTTVIIPHAASKGFGSLYIDKDHLLRTEMDELAKLGYKVRFSSGGEFGTDRFKVIWDRKSPKQGFWLSDLPNSNDKLESLPN